VIGADKDYRRFYPGDEFADWWGIDLFSVEHFDAANTVAFMRDAAARRYPVMIGESTPRFVGVQDGAASWEKWFAKYFAFIRAHRHCKAFCYINWNWAGYPQWADWGDGRITANAEVLRRYREELRDTLYVGRIA